MFVCVCFSVCACEHAPIARLCATVHLTQVLAINLPHPSPGRPRAQQEWLRVSPFFKLTGGGREGGSELVKG